MTHGGNIPLLGTARTAEGILLREATRNGLSPEALIDIQAQNQADQLEVG